MLISTIVGIPPSNNKEEGKENKEILEEKDKLNNPCGIFVDKEGNLYIADTYNYVIRKVSPNGKMNIIVGKKGIYGYLDGNINEALIGWVYGIVLDSKGNIYLLNSYIHVIRKVSNDKVSIFVGKRNESGFKDGNGSEARFNNPFGITIDSNDNLFIADSGNHIIRKIESNGNVITICGNPGKSGFKDGYKENSLFNYPESISIDSHGNIWVADYSNNCIRKISSNGNVSTPFKHDIFTHRPMYF